MRPAPAKKGAPSPTITDHILGRTDVRTPGVSENISWPPSDHDLTALTNRELAQRYGVNYTKIANYKRRGAGIHMDPAARERAYAQRFPAPVSGPVASQQMIAALESQGYRISKALPHEPVVRLKGAPGTRYRCAVVCCTHLGNVAQQLTYLHDFYRYAESQGITEFWNAGDTTDGPDSMHRDAVHEHFLHTFDAAVDYWVANYPKPKHGKTRLILGNHDESWLKDPAGADIGRAIALRRPDVEYVGRRAAEVHVGGLRIYLLHGAGGASYARSYKLQKIVEGFAPSRRPHILLAGNWHVPAAIPDYLGCDAFMLPSFEKSTPFITSLGKESVIGGLLLDIELGQAGARSLTATWKLYPEALVGDHPK